MSSSPPTPIPIPPLNPLEDLAQDAGTPSPGSPPLGYVPPRLQLQENMLGRRVSFSQSQPAVRRSSGVPLTRTISTTGWRSVRDTEALLSPVSERPPIPSALTSGGPRGLYATPLPKLPLVVLSIVSYMTFNHSTTLKRVRSDHARRVPIGKCLYTIFTLYGRGYVYRFLLLLVISERIHAGFMAGDENADVGYWTGILG